MPSLTFSRPLLISRIASLIFLIAICSSAIQAQQKFGYVLDVRGDWTINGGSKLAKGSALNVGSVITAGNPADGGSYIVVADRSGNIFDKRNCGAGECANPIRLPSTAVQEQSVVSRLISAAMALVSNEPAKYSSFVSRGADLREAVVQLNNDQMDLAEVFQNMQSDRYLVRYETISKNGPNTAHALKPFEFNWDSKKPVPLAARGLLPGLYRVSIAEVSLLEPEGSGDASGNEAWVLVATPKAYAKAAPMFTDAQNMTKRWGTNVKQTTVRGVLRASLDAITAETKQ